MKFILTTAALAVLVSLPLAADTYGGNAQTRTVLDTSTNVAGQTIAWPQSAPAKATIAEIDIPPGGDVGWHKHPVPLFGYVISGTLTIHFADGTKKPFGPGQGFAEAENIIHDGHNDGAEPLKFVVFIAGEKGVNYTEKMPMPK